MAATKPAVRCVWPARTRLVVWAVVFPRRSVPTFTVTTAVTDLNVVFSIGRNPRPCGFVKITWIAFENVVRQLLDIQEAGVFASRAYHLDSLSLKAPSLFRPKPFRCSPSESFGPDRPRGCLCCDHVDPILASRVGNHLLIRWVQAFPEFLRHRQHATAPHP